MNLFHQTPSRLGGTFRSMILMLPALLAAALTHADGPSADKSVYVVSYDPRSLYSEAGREALRLRIHHAARIVCERARIYDEYSSCVDRSTHRALAAVEARRTALQEGRTLSRMDRAQVNMAHVDIQAQ